jgi:hypothetical protein
MTQTLWIVFVVVVLCICGVRSSAQVVPEESNTTTTGSIVTFHIEHALDPLRQHFTPRTRIQLMIKADGRQGIKYLDRNVLALSDMEQFKALIANHDLYTIRIRLEKADWKGHFVTTSIPVVSEMHSFN